MPTVFIDTNIPMYAGGAEHPLRSASQRIVLAVANPSVASADAGFDSIASIRRIDPATFAG